MHALTISVLVLIFLLGTLRNINLGILGLIGAFLVALAVPEFADAAEDSGDVFDQVFGGFPVDLMIALLGLTYLFGFAQQNGTIDIILSWAIRAVRGNRAVMPWIFFALSGIFMSIGAIFALSPLSVYGIYVNDFLKNNDLGSHTWTLFLMALVFNVLMGAIVFVFLGGRRLIGAQARAEMAEIRAEMEDTANAETTETGSGSTTVATATTRAVTPYQWATIVGLAALVIGAGIFALDIGVVSLTIGGVLAIMKPVESRKALDNVSWATIVLVGGMVTYIEVLQAAGTVDWISDKMSSMGAPMIGLLLLCYLSGVVSALASSIATIGIAITMAAPFLVNGDLPVAGAAAAIAVAATVVDVSPFSTNGAMVLANVDAEHRDKFFRQMLVYSGVVVAVGPLAAWLMVLLPF